MCLCREKQTSTVSKGERELGPLCTLLATTYSSYSVVFDMEYLVALLDPFEKGKKEKKEKKNKQKSELSFS